MGKSNFSRSEAPVQRASEPYFPRGKEKKAGVVSLFLILLYKKQGFLSITKDLANYWNCISFSFSDASNRFWVLRLDMVVGYFSAL